METGVKREPMTREKARALIKRLLDDSMRTRIEMEETFHTDPGIQAAVAELRKLREQKQEIQSKDGV